jgi:hypothetical protein
VAWLFFSGVCYAFSVPAEPFYAFSVVFGPEKQWKAAERGRKKMFFFGFLIEIYDWRKLSINYAPQHFYAPQSERGKKNPPRSTINFYCQHTASRRFSLIFIEFPFFPLSAWMQLSYFFIKIRLCSRDFFINLVSPGAVELFSLSHFTFTSSLAKLRRFPLRFGWQLQLLFHVVPSCSVAAKSCVQQRSNDACCRVNFSTSALNMCPCRFVCS